MHMEEILNTNIEKERKDYPLSDTQMEVYTNCKNCADALYYNLPFLYEMDRTINVKRLREAVGEAMDAHPMTKTVFFKDSDGKVRQIRQDDFIPDIPIMETKDSEYEQDVKELIQPLELDGGALYRIVILTTETKTGLFVMFHRAITDGTSYKIFLQDVVRSYQKGKGYLNHEEYTGFDEAGEFMQRRQGKEFKEAENYYRRLLENTETDSLPVSTIVKKGVKKEKGLYQAGMNKSLVCKIEAFCENLHISKNILLLAAFGITIRVFNHTEEAVFNTIYHGRKNEKYKNTFGMMAKTLPVVMPSEKNINRMLKQLKIQMDKTRKQDVYSFTDMVKEYNLVPDMQFIYQGDAVKTMEILLEPLGGKLRSDIAFASKRAQYPFFMQAYKNGFDEIIVKTEYETDRYDFSFIKNFTNAYLKAVEQLMSCKTTDEISLFGEDDNMLVKRFNQTEQLFSTQTNIVEMFREQARRTPEHICVVYGKDSYTYHEVDVITDRIAAYLQKKGCCSQDVVSIYIGRNEHMVLASLGALKTGAAYQPMVSDYEPERLRYMIKDSKAKYLITEREFVSSLNEYNGEILFIDQVANLPDEKPVDIPINPDSLFILLYTSGTTGVPKGVKLTHQNLVAFCQHNHRKFKLTSRDRWGAYATYGFDAHMMELFLMLTCGGTVYIIPDEIRLDLKKMNQYFIQNAITISFMTTQVGQQFQQFVTAPSLRYLLTGGEKLLPIKPRAEFEFWNLYGPTENTVFISSQKVEQDYIRVPIGRPSSNLKFYVVDKQLRQVPVGAVGELICAGAQVGEGYLNQEKESKQDFIKNPFSDDPMYRRAYRTGDLVRYLSDGTLDFIGREDSQVKIRGFRIELGEVEAVIQSYPDVEETTAVVLEHAAGDKYIAAYVVSEKKVNTDALISYIRQRKPEYMVPSVILQIPEIPLTANHKVNKRALPKPEMKERKPLEGPENQRQKELLELIAQITGNYSMGIKNDMFQSGLNSIGAMHLLVMISRMFHADIKIGDLRENPTVEKLDGFLKKGRKRTVYEKQADYPLTRTQSGILAECMSHPGTTIYNIPILLTLPGKINAEKLVYACRKTVDSHSYLKGTIYFDDRGEIRFRRNDQVMTQVKVVKGEPDKNRLVKPFQLMDGKLYRILIFTGSAHVYLFLDFHHIIFDGISLKILMSDIEKAYYDQELETEEYTGFDVALEEQQLLKTDALIKAKTYYSGLLNDVEIDYLPSKDSKKIKPGRKDLVMQSENGVDCEAFCKQINVTMNAFFLSAFGFLISKYNGREDALFTTIYNGRNDSRMSGTVDMLVKTYPIYIQYAGETSISDFCQSVRDQILTSMSYDIYSFADICADYGIRADYLFAYQGDGFSKDTFGGEKIEFEKLALDLAKTPISLNVVVQNNKVCYVLEYRDDMYSEEKMSSMLECYIQIIEEFLVKNKLREVSLVSRAEVEKINSFNQTKMKLERTTANVLLERKAEEVSEKTAIIGNGEMRTYRELNENANRIAWSLRSLGVKEGDVVAFLLRRGVSVYEVREGILKAGAAFLCIGENYRDDRICYILKDSKSVCLITETDFLKTESTFLKQIKTVSLEELYQNNHIENPVPAITPENPAYCIYTSGSTGKPKGVIICHRNLVNYVLCAGRNEAMEQLIKRTKTALAVTAFTFDASVHEECFWLYHGKTVCIASEEARHNPLVLAEFIQTYQVNSLTGTPSLLAGLLAVPEMKTALSQICCYYIGGEDFTKSLLQTIHSLNPGALVINAYGPTEATVACTAEVLTDTKKITIGKPLGNMEIYIVDQYGNMLPPEFPGEMLIAGEGVGKGYVGMKEETAEKFITFRKTPAYHSGDLACWNLDGTISFAGRMDQQIKLRGLRVEPGEIEAVMNTYPGITSSVVLVKGAEENKYLCAYYTGNREINRNHLKEYLGQHLADYMVPGVLMPIERMPLTVNGKIDKKKLPEPEMLTRDIPYTAPSTQIQKLLCEAFELALGRKKVGVEDDFFLLGGTSILASKVAMKCMAEKLPVVYADIFRYKTPLQLEQCILEKSGEKEDTVKKIAVSSEKRIDRRFSRILSHPAADEAMKMKRVPLGNVLITGVTGFLGIHVLKEYLEQNNGYVYCLVRPGNDGAERRLREQTAYYFGMTFWEMYSRRIRIVEGDITVPDSVQSLKSYDFSTLIHCAACVKHFAADDILEKVNMDAVKLLTNLCKENSRKMIHISTVSVAGNRTTTDKWKSHPFVESDFDISQIIGNQYVLSKYKAEEIMLAALEEGMSGKIIRVGNLMGRAIDGKFQRNRETNGFLRRLRGYEALGEFPVSFLTQQVEFSPIDETAEAILKLAELEDKMHVFHVYNSRKIPMADVFDVLKERVPLKCVSDEVFQKDLLSAVSNSKNETLAGLVAYLPSKEEIDTVPNEPDNAFTTQVLYLLGFSWTTTEKKYLKKFILTNK